MFLSVSLENISFYILQIPSDLTCVHYHSASDIVFFGTLNFTIVAVDHENRTLLWTFRLADSVVDVVSQENNVYVALADGTITIFKVRRLTCVRIL